MNIDHVKSTMNFAFIAIIGRATHYLTDEGYTKSRTSHNVELMIEVINKYINYFIVNNLVMLQKTCDSNVKIISHLNLFFDIQ